MSDILDDILFIEEDFIKKGFNSGIEAGEEFGKTEGLECGIENGYSFGMEIGFYKGFIKIYKNHVIDKETDEKKKEHQLKLFNGINELINSFIENPDTATLKKINSKFKMLISNVKEKQSILNQISSLQYNTKPKSEKPLCFKGEDIDF